MERLLFTCLVMAVGFFLGEERLPSSLVPEPQLIDSVLHPEKPDLEGAVLESEKSILEMCEKNPAVLRLNDVMCNKNQF